MNEDDIEWIRKRIWQHISSTYKSTDDEFNKRALERHVRSMMMRIERDKPADIRAYVENVYKRQAYIEELRMLMKLAAALDAGDDKGCDDLEERINTLLKKAEKDFPGFSEANRRFISELHGDLLAVRSKGKMGSARMLMKLTKSGSARTLQKLAKKK